MTQKELGYVELEWTCKHCGTINPAMKRVCTNCGAPISKEHDYVLLEQQLLITDKEKLDAAQKGPTIQCPYCSVLNPADARLCLHCGGDIQEGLRRKAGEVLGAYQPDAVPDKPCPFCNQPVKADAQRCPHCGGSLIKDAAPIATSSPAKKIPIWYIIGGAVVGVLCLTSIIVYLVMSNRTNDITATVAAIQWQRTIDILEKQPVQKSAWKDEVPSQVQDLTCRDKYKETSSNPAPNSTEVCGTPYTIDTGSGAGKVVQDCEYQVYASYCNFTILDWVVVTTSTAQGADTNPQWPALNLQASQQEGSRHESYLVTFTADGQTYSYTAADAAEFAQYAPSSQWILSINTFGDIKDIRTK